MPKLLVQMNQLDYVGLFSAPALGLWGEGGKILQGLYNAFSGYQINLADLRNESSSLNPSDQVIAVRFGSVGEYRFRFDRVELKLLNFTKNSLAEAPGVLAVGDEWLRSLVPGLGFKSHLFATVSHSRLLNGTAREFLLGLPSLNIDGVGVSEGPGVIFHWDLPEKGWKVQFAMDHSLSVEGGLFINFLIRPNGDTIDYSNLLVEGDKLFERILSKIGLEVTEDAAEY